MSASRKQQHVELAVNSDVRFRAKTSGFDAIELPYNALPEIDLADVDTATTFLGKPLAMPLMVTGMTGGYPDAERINALLAEACVDVGVAMGLGSMRSALKADADAASFSVVRPSAAHIPVIANIGAVQLVEEHRAGRLVAALERLVALVDASGLAVHLNPLQELLQPEGEPRFSGVLEAIAEAVAASPVPVIVKEVGAGISGSVAQRLADVGVTTIDVAGAGGTSWAGVEILRREEGDRGTAFWDVGLPTAECLQQCRGIVPTLIASGGVTSGTDAAKALALGAHMAGVARPALQAVMREGTDGLVTLLQQWHTDLRRWMFLTGSPTLHRFVDLLHR